MQDIFSISEVTQYLRELLDSDPLLSDLWLRGEISNWVKARSGHCYFTLKDAGAEIRCVMWQPTAAALPVLPRDGDEVVAAGYVSVYPERGKYQFYVGEMQPLGLGALYRRFEVLKETLESEGLFDDACKKELPRFPRRIGVVTSPTAAALQDVLNVLHRRHPLVEVVISPTLVQGNGAPDGIVRALRRFERVRVDLIIMARGGGSIEDLWAFNEEVVARAIHACETPVITGIGHEIDYTIADFVADRRAPTPSAAAEVAVPDIREWRDRLRDTTGSLESAMSYELDMRRRQLEQERRALERAAPERRLGEQRQSVDHLWVRLERAWMSRTRLQQSKLAGLHARLGSLDPRATLARGYAIVTGRDGVVVRRAGQIASGEPITIVLGEGEIEATVSPRATAPARRAGGDR